MASTLFIADLHLSPHAPARTERFARFVADVAVDAESLYILGDMFEYWIGPDHVSLPDHRPALEALRHLRQWGTRVHLLRGNRDFLMGDSVEAWTGARVHGERVDLTLDGRRVVALHGDALCARDRSYQTYKRVARSPVTQAVFLALPLALRRRIGAGFRGASDTMVQAKPDAVRGLHRPTIARVFSEGADVVVCGHVHRAESTPVPVNGRTGRFYVVGGWEQGPTYLEFDGHDFRMRAVP